MAERKVYNVYREATEAPYFQKVLRKFIAWGVGSLVGAIVLGGLIGSVVNAYLGGITMVLVTC